MDEMKTLMSLRRKEKIVFVSGTQMTLIYCSKSMFTPRYKTFKENQMINTHS